MPIKQTFHIVLLTDTSRVEEYISNIFTFWKYVYVTYVYKNILSEKIFYFKEKRKKDIIE